MLTRASVHCADRIVAASSWNGFSWSSSQRASGYSRISRRMVSRARPAGVRGRPTSVVCRGVPVVEIEGGDLSAPDLSAAIERAAADGDTVRWWVHGTEPRHEELAAAVGLAPKRRLFQMRCPLPPAETTDVETRPFRPGEDDEAWLAVNNRAFHWHPEQGGWTEETLAGRLAEPWFDADGFLLHEEDGRLIGFCWTKV